MKQQKSRWSSIRYIKCALLIFILGTGNTSKAQSLDRGPYLQMATPNSIVIRWRTNSNTDSKVTYGTDSLNLAQAAVVAGTRKEHTVLLSGLQPHTRYYYSVGNANTILQAGSSNYFITSPMPNAEGKYTFWVAGDCGENNTHQKNVRDRYYDYIGDKPTDGFLLLGDNAYFSGWDSEYSSSFFDIYESNILKHSTIWPAPGNHDYSNFFAYQYSHNIPYYDIFNLPTNGEAGGVPSGHEEFYSYDYGNIHFLSLDSYGYTDNDRLYDTAGTQVQWIKQDLAANTKKWTIAYWHHPPYTMGSHNSDTEGELVDIRSKFIQILERNGVDLIMCGHSHNYERSKLMKGHYGKENTFDSTLFNLSQSSGMYDGSPNSCTYLKDSLHTLDGTVYVVSGSAGKLSGTEPGYPHNAMPFSNATEGGSLILEIEGSRLDAKFLATDGVIRDKFTLIKDASKVRTIYRDLGQVDSLTFTSSWRGNYQWSHSNDTTKTVTVLPQTTTTYIVTDQYECVADSFYVIVGVPTITPFLFPTNTICAGNSIVVPYGKTGRFFNGNVFTLQLSDSTGSFANPVILGSRIDTVAGIITGVIPDSTLAGSNYVIRIVSSIPAVNGFSSSYKIPILPFPQVTLTGSGVNNSSCVSDSLYFKSSGATFYKFFVDGIQQGSIATVSVFKPAQPLQAGQIVSVIGSTGCGSDTASVTVYVAPQVSFTGLDSIYYVGASGATLTGIPAGGTFTGTGVVGNGFYAVLAGLGGPYAVTYTYTDLNGCRDVYTATTHVEINTGLVSFENKIGLQVYPNPTAESGTVKFSLAEQTKIEIVLIDKLGRQIMVLEKTTMQAGINGIEISKTKLNLAAGVYDLKVKVGEQIALIKIAFQ